MKWPAWLQREVTALREADLLGLRPDEEIIVAVRPGDITVQNVNMGTDPRENALRIAQHLLRASYIMFGQAGVQLNIGQPMAPPAPPNGNGAHAEAPVTAG